MTDMQFAAVYLVAFFSSSQIAIAVSRGSPIPIKSGSDKNRPWLKCRNGWWIRAWCCWARIWALRWEAHRSAGNCLSHGSSIQISIWAIHHLEVRFLPLWMCTTAVQSVCISAGLKNITHFETSISKRLHLLMGLGRLSSSSLFMHALKNTHKYVFSQI